MNVEGYNIVLLLHILMFGYWLGVDLRVFFCDSQMTRDDLDIEERLRVHRIRYKVDMAARTCLVSIIALKMLFFGLICWNGIWIMRSADHWYRLIEMARRGGEERMRAEPLMKTTRFWCATSAGVLWFLVLVVAFPGTVKPL